MADLLPDLIHEFKRHKTLADNALSQLDDEAFFHRPGATNPVANIVKHLAGNLASRWTDFLTTDGEKPTRDRDGEFVVAESDTRQNLLAAWERGWKILFDALSSLKESDLERTITIRGEAMSAQQAIIRALTHAAYHVGQILYLVRWLRPEGTWLTIAPNRSRGFPGEYRKTQ